MSDPKDPKKLQIHVPENVPVDYQFERMLKSFMKDVDKTGILKEVKTRRYYVKPSEVRRLTKKAQRRKHD